MKVVKQQRLFAYRKLVFGIKRKILGMVKYWILPSDGSNNS